MEREFGQSLGKVGDSEAKESNDAKPLSSSSSRRRDWLGGLDSNQDSQIQSLESYQLDDLPADENAGLTSYRDRFLWGKQGHLSEFYAKL